jgi:hypothetical protein
MAVVLAALSQVLEAELHPPQPVAERINATRKPREKRTRRRRAACER